MSARVCITFPLFQWGGAEAVLAWMVEALKARYRLSVVTLDPPDLEQVNSFYGTGIRASDLEWRNPAEVSSVRALIPLARRSFSFRQSLVARFVRMIGSEFDVLISAFNEMDLGYGGVQYIHFPMFSPKGKRLRHRLGYPDSAPHNLVKRLLQLSTGWSAARVLANRSLANSRWTAQAVRAIYGTECQVVYPPVWSAFPALPWENREDGFVLVSRGVLEKRIARAVRILQAVRNRGFAIHLHIIGELSDAPVRRLVFEARDRFGDWIQIEGRVSREEFAQLLGSHKYGIHVRDYEQFGIAVAEMVRAGCIPFVPNSGGQVEILDSHAAITFESDEEAVRKVSRVILDGELQAGIRHKLAECGARFSASRFCRAIESVVEEELRAAPSPRQSRAG